MFKKEKCRQSIDVCVCSVPSQAVYGDTGDPRQLQGDIQDQQLLLEEPAIAGALDFAGANSFS